MVFVLGNPYSAKLPHDARVLAHSTGSIINLGIHRGSPVMRHPQRSMLQMEQRSKAVENVLNPKPQT